MTTTSFDMPKAEERYAMVEMEGSEKTEISKHWTVGQAEQAASQRMSEFDYTITCRVIDLRTGRLIPLPKKKEK